MDLKDILLDYRNNKKSLDEVIDSLSLFSIEHIENQVAQLDVNRSHRKLVPEIVLATHKKPRDLLLIVNRILQKKGYVLVSKINPSFIKKLGDYFDKMGYIVDNGRNSTSLLIYKDESSLPRIREGKVGIICAGTSDIGIAEEARLATRVMGCSSYVSYDVGIAGIHRLIGPLKEMTLEKVDAIVAIAGMEGALPVVVTSLVNVPVIGVPTSIGYGFGGNGVGALASMLQTCSFGLSIVNIDNGIGGGIFASMIANK
jgi:pyridinium-3,5-biscarboxylic acid mononucleotide synthase